MTPAVGLKENSIDKSTDDPWVLVNSDLPPEFVATTASSRSLSKIGKDSVSGERLGTPYPRRKNMGECPPLFGNVTVFVAFAETSYQT